GMTFVILSGGIDLSVGAVIGFTGVLVAVLISWAGVHPLLAFAIAILVAGAFGAIMGLAIHYLQVPAFIVTLAGMFLARGGASVITRDSVPINHEFYALISDLTIRLPGGGRLSVIGLTMVAIFIIGALIAHRTKFGSYVYALGGNPVSASLMGVPVARTTVAIYALSSVLAAISGIVFSLYTSAGYPLAAVGVELDAISAVVIGGTLLTGGYGFVLGTFIGVMLLGLVQTYIIFDGTLSSWWTKIVIGILLFLFIVLQRLIFVASAPGEKAQKA
ncbi:MAG: sugar ABC transporter permease YjfF, partial [Rhizobiaceae bacterium]